MSSGAESMDERRKMEGTFNLVFGSLSVSRVVESAAYSTKKGRMTPGGPYKVIHSPATNDLVYFEKGVYVMIPLNIVGAHAPVDKSEAPVLELVLKSKSGKSVHVGATEETEESAEGRFVPFVIAFRGKSSSSVVAKLSYQYLMHDWGVFYFSDEMSSIYEKILPMYEALTTPDATEAQWLEYFKHYYLLSSDVGSISPSLFSTKIITMALKRLHGTTDVLLEKHYRPSKELMEFCQKHAIPDSDAVMAAKSLVISTVSPTVIAECGSGHLSQETLNSMQAQYNVMKSNHPDSDFRGMLDAQAPTVAKLFELSKECSKNAAELAKTKNLDLLGLLIGTNSDRYDADSFHMALRYKLVFLAACSGMAVIGRQLSPAMVDMAKNLAEYHCNRGYVPLKARLESRSRMINGKLNPLPEPRTNEEINKECVKSMWNYMSSVDTKKWSLQSITQKDADFDVGFVYFTAMGFSRAADLSTYLYYRPMVLSPEHKKLIFVDNTDPRFPLEGPYAPRGDDYLLTVTDMKSAMDNAKEYARALQEALDAEEARKAELKKKIELLPKPSPKPPHPIHEPYRGGSSHFVPFTVPGVSESDEMDVSEQQKPPGPSAPSTGEKKDERKASNKRKEPSAPKPTSPKQPTEGATGMELVLPDARRQVVARRSQFTLNKFVLEQLATGRSALFRYVTSPDPSVEDAQELKLAFLLKKDHGIYATLVLPGAAKVQQLKDSNSEGQISKAFEAGFRNLATEIRQAIEQDKEITFYKNADMVEETQNAGELLLWLFRHVFSDVIKERIEKALDADDAEGQPYRKVLSNALAEWLGKRENIRYRLIIRGAERFGDGDEDKDGDKDETSDSDKDDDNQPPPPPSAGPSSSKKNAQQPPPPRQHPKKNAPKSQPGEPKKGRGRPRKQPPEAAAKPQGNKGKPSDDPKGLPDYVARLKEMLEISESGGEGWPEDYISVLLDSYDPGVKSPVINMVWNAMRGYIAVKGAARGGFGEKIPTKEQSIVEFFQTRELVAASKIAGGVRTYETGKDLRETILEGEDWKAASDLRMKKRKSKPKAKKSGEDRYKITQIVLENLHALKENMINLASEGPSHTDPNKRKPPIEWKDEYIFGIVPVPDDIPHSDDIHQQPNAVRFYTYMSPAVPSKRYARDEKKNDGAGQSKKAPKQWAAHGAWTSQHNKMRLTTVSGEEELGFNYYHKPTFNDRIQFMPNRDPEGKHTRLMKSDPESFYYLSPDGRLGNREAAIRIANYVYPYEIFGKDKSGKEVVIHKLAVPLGDDTQEQKMVEVSYVLDQAVKGPEDFTVLIGLLNKLDREMLELAKKNPVIKGIYDRRTNTDFIYTPGYVDDVTQPGHPERGMTSTAKNGGKYKKTDEWALFRGEYIERPKRKRAKKQEKKAATVADNSDDSDDSDDGEEEEEERNPVPKAPPKKAETVHNSDSGSDDSDDSSDSSDVSD